jgi:hypothetical protein
MINLNRKSRTNLVTLLEKAIEAGTVPADEVKFWEAFVRELKKPSVGPADVSPSRKGGS